MVSRACPEKVSYEYIRCIFYDEDIVPFDSTARQEAKKRIEEAIAELKALCCMYAKLYDNQNIILAGELDYLRTCVTDSTKMINGYMMEYSLYDDIELISGIKEYKNILFSLIAKEI